MKYGLFIPAALLLFSACKKTDTPNPPNTNSDNMLASMTYYRPLDHSRSLESFYYNDNEQLASIRVHSYDTAGGVNYADSALLSFAVTTATTPPAAYDITWFKDGNPPTGSAEHHLLFYDDQNRVIKDSISVSTENDLSTLYFTYDNGNIAIQWSYPDPNSPTGYSAAQIDTFFTAAGNLSKTVDYSAVYGFDQQNNYVITQQNFNEMNAYSYSTYTNPLFQASLSNSLGAMLRFGNTGDFISQNLAATWQNTIDQFQPPVSLSYTWQTDAAGRVTQGWGINSTTPVVEEIYTFIYQ